MATIDNYYITVDELRRYIESYQTDNIIPIDDDCITEGQGQLGISAVLAQLIDKHLLQLAACHRGWLEKNETNPERCHEAELRILEEIGRQASWPTLKEAREYYQQHLQEFKTDTRYQLEHLLFSSEHSAWEIREKITAGKLTLAEAGRQGFGGARLANCGRNNFVTLDELPPELARSLVHLEPGKLSQVIASPYGYHLVRISTRKTAGYIPFTELENRIKDTIFTRRLRKQYRQWREQQRGKHSIQIFPEHLEPLMSAIPQR